MRTAIRESSIRLSRILGLCFACLPIELIVLDSGGPDPLAAPVVTILVLSAYRLREKAHPIIAIGEALVAVWAARFLFDATAVPSLSDAIPALAVLAIAYALVVALIDRRPLVLVGYLIAVALYFDGFSGGGLIRHVYGPGEDMNNWFLSTTFMTPFTCLMWTLLVSVERWSLQRFRGRQSLPARDAQEQLRRTKPQLQIGLMGDRDRSNKGFDRDSRGL